MTSNVNNSNNPVINTSTSPNIVDESKENTQFELDQLTNKLHEGLDIKNRKWILSTYDHCFIGNDAVTYMVNNHISKSRKSAVNLGQMLLAANIIRHVTNDHNFKDEHKFYTFTMDDASHGQKAQKDNKTDWSWSDFIPGKNSSKLSINLQPEMRDMNEEMKYAEDVQTLKVEDTFGISPLDEYNQELLDNVHPVKWIAPEPQARYNLVAIGAGAAGLVSAAGTAGIGGKSAIVEEHLFGGDCLNTGCVPSKALLRAAKVASDAIINGTKYGLVVNGTITIDFALVMERMRRIRAEISHHDACLRFSKDFGLDVFLGHATFLNADTIQVGKHKLRFARCVIATGARPSVPPIPGLADCAYITSHTIWNLTELPARLGVIGAGPVGCEMAQAFALFGSKVTVLNRDEHILHKEDAEAAQIVRTSMENSGCSFVTGVKFISCESSNDGNCIRVTIEHENETQQFTFDSLLIATGRKPNVNGMGLEAANVEFDESKGILVNDFLQTSNSNIYAAGDCCTRFQFTHMAEAMARIVIRNALFFGRSKVSNLIVPWCTYTFPEIAHVGLYEKDLHQRSIEYDVIKVDLTDNDRAICDGESHYHGFVKVLVKKGSDSILGGTIVSENAGDQISELTLAIQANIGLGFLGSVIHPYPTVAEGIKHAGDAYNKTKLTPINKALLRRFLSARR